MKEKKNEVITRPETYHIEKTKDKLNDIGIDMQLAQFYLDTKLFGNKSPQNIVLTMMIGRRLGIDEIQALSGDVYIFQNKGAMLIQTSGKLIGAAIKNNPDYDYKVLENTREKCKIEFYEKDNITDKMKVAGTYEYTLKDAEEAGLLGKDNWKHPKLMLFYRCLSQGYKIHIYRALAMPVYTAEEVANDIKPKPEQVMIQEATTINGEEINPTEDDKPIDNNDKPVDLSRPYGAEVLKERINIRASINGILAPHKVCKKVLADLNTMTSSSGISNAVIQYLFDKDSSNKLTVGECTAVDNWLGIDKNDEIPIASKNAYLEYEMIMELLAENEEKEIQKDEETSPDEIEEIEFKDNYGGAVTEDIIEEVPEENEAPQASINF